MADMTYDPEADAVYVYLGRGDIARQEEAGPFICDVDAQGRGAVEKPALRRGIPC